jgi:hypothetical protein
MEVLTAGADLGVMLPPRSEGARPFSTADSRSRRPGIRHATLSNAAAEVMESLYGNRRFAITLTSAAVAIGSSRLEGTIKNPRRRATGDY